MGDKEQDFEAVRDMSGMTKIPPNYPQQLSIDGEVWSRQLYSYRPPGAQTILWHFVFVDGSRLMVTGNVGLLIGRPKDE